MRHLVLIVSLFIGIFYSSDALSSKRDSSVLFFSGNRLYPIVFLDPLECQVNGGSYFLFREGSNGSLYSHTNFGITRPVITKYGDLFSWEMNFGAGTFTQFDLIRKDDGSYLAGLLNNDYKLSTDLNIQRKNHNIHLRIFHLSSHLGDDYIIRNNDSLLNDKSMNYEQIDLTYLRLRGENYWYAGIGEIYTKHVFRKRLSFQGGGLVVFGIPKTVNPFLSVNLKMFAENDFIPDVRTATGVNVMHRTQPIMRLWFEYYSGELPYGTLHYGRVSWIGLAMAVNLL